MRVYADASPAAALLVQDVQGTGLDTRYIRMALGITSFVARGGAVGGLCFKRSSYQRIAIV